MANIGLFKLMITLVICMLGGVRGHKFFKTKTTAGISDALPESIFQTRCAIILEASFELEVVDIQDYSVIWDTSLNNMPTSKLAIGLQKHHLIEVLEEAGFLIQRGSTAHEVKMCRYICDNKKTCKNELWLRYENLSKWHQQSKLIYSPTEMVEVKNFFRQKRKKEFQNLSREKKKKLLFDRYMRRAERIARWQKTTAEHHFHLYETASININIARCLNKWRVNVLYRDNLCTTTALILATRANHLSFTGENACLSTDENSFTQVHAGPGLELTTSRDHLVISSRKRYLAVTILGLPYLLQFPAEGSKGIIWGDKNKKNSLLRLANYLDLDRKLYSKSWLASISYKREKLTIAGDQHNQAHENQQFVKNVISNATAQIMKSKQLSDGNPII